MAIYDKELFYTLKPGQFVFENREFSTDYLVNSMGLRDDETSLDHPKIVMLGDSYGMGWGVDQNESYASLVESELGITVLNAGISSYGTPREVTMLERINTDSLEYLVIQYCNNDKYEIGEYMRHNNELIVSNELKYDSICEFVRTKASYYPFKHTIQLLPLIFSQNTEEKPKIDNSTPAVNTSRGFIEMIRSSNKIPAHTQIIIFALNGIEDKNYFTSEIEHLIGTEIASSLQDRCSFIDFDNDLGSDHYFRLDNHINKNGHRLVADSIIKLIRSSTNEREVKKWFYPDGAICIQAEYKGKLKDGKATYYWPNGQVSQVSYFSRGSKIREDQRFNKQGVEL